jgi:hypothetical protein
MRGVPQSCGCTYTKPCALCAARIEKKAARDRRNEAVRVRREKKREARAATICNVTVQATEKESAARWMKVRAEMGWEPQPCPDGHRTNQPCGVTEAVPGSRACAEHLPIAICNAKKKLRWHKRHADDLSTLIGAMQKVVYNNVIKRSCE